MTKHDDSQETRKLTVNVSGSGCGDPLIHYFSPTTYYVRAGEPFSISWHVECAKAIWFIAGYGSERPPQGQE